MLKQIFNVSYMIKIAQSLWGENELLIAKKTLCSLKLFVVRWEQTSDVNTFPFVCLPIPHSVLKLL